VQLSFALSVSTLGQPTLDSWTWDRWQALSTRLVVDGAPRFASGASLDPLVQVTDSARGTVVLSLPRGSHTVKMQWRHSGSGEALSWRTAQDLLDGFGGGAALLSLAHFANQPPRVEFDPTDRDLRLQLAVAANAGVEAAEGEPVVWLAVPEDGELAVQGFSIADEDEALRPDSVFAVTIRTSHGVVSLNRARLEGVSFASGTGDRDQVVVLTGALGSVNRALESFTYQGALDWNGEDLLRVEVDDQGNSNLGAGGALSAFYEVGVRVAAVNDAPTFSTPNYQRVDEDTPLVIYGITLHDVDVALAEEKLLLQQQQQEEEGVVDVSAIVVPSPVFQVSVFVAGGSFSLASVEGLAFAAGTGVRDRAATFSGSLSDVNAALGSLVYQGDRDANKVRGPEALTLVVSDLGTENGPDEARAKIGLS
jgi:hypothetical protein